MNNGTWIWIAAITAALFVLGGCAGSIATRRSLRELGSIAIPKRLENRAPQESSSLALFPFDRVESGFRYMGSNTPIAERLVIAAWTAGSREDARTQAIRLAQDRISVLRWLDPETAEGTHEVNTHETPSWVIVCEDPARGLTAAYMVWKKDAPSSPENIREQLSKVLNSFAPSNEVAAYLRIAADRPGMERRRRTQVLEASLAKRGIRGVELDGGPVQQDGAWYELYTEPRRSGRAFAVLLPIGELPLRSTYKPLRPATPRNVGNWPSMQWFYRDDNGDTEQKSFDGTIFLSDRMLRAIPTDATKARFYAAELFLLDDLEMPEPALDFIWDMQPRMAALFSDDKFVE